MAKIKIEVTQEDIDLGERAHAFSCPLVRAIKRQTNQVCSVGSEDVFFYTEQRRVFQKAMLPDAANTFRAAFDMGEPVAPFTFELEVK